MKFLVDHMLGRLVKYLRMLGVDTVYFTQNDVTRLIEKASQEKRIILSRNAKLKNIGGLSNFVFINGDRPDKQLGEVIDHFKIRIPHDYLFTRCLTCNQKLIAATHEDVKEKVPSYILGVHKKFSLCTQCNKVYWEGTHLKKMKEMMGKVLGKKEPGNNFGDG